jgi:multicomponent Na+:H+ antiporter subunit A
MTLTQPDNRQHAAGRSKAGMLSTVLPLGLFTGLCTLWPEVVRGHVFQLHWSWIPSLDLNLQFRLDGLSLLFGLIVTAAGFFVTLYASSYMAGHPHSGRFFVFLHAFMIAMLGIILADNLLLLFVFWEATTVFSYLLIGFDHESETARDHAKQAILVTGAGGLALLIGILLLKIAGGTFTLSQWAVDGDQIRQHALYPFILIAILLGAMTKSAQFPFHFWLPNAMSAPTPISAFLHAATMVKAGIYLLMRFHPLMGGTTAWMATLVIVGGVTALWGAIQALGPCDLKRVLAYTTMMALGILTMFLGGQSAASMTAAATFLLVHALYKASLFLAVGSIDHATGTRRLDRLGGLWRSMPITALAVAAATMSMAGFPLFFGFIGKEIMYEGALAEEMFPLFTVTAALLSNALMTAVAAVVILVPFAGRRPPRLPQTHDPEWTMWIGPLVLGGLGILFGIIPEWVSANLIQPAVWALNPKQEGVLLTIFHGFNLPLLLSVITLTLGAVFYGIRRWLGGRISAAVDRLPISAAGAYDRGLYHFMQGAKGITRRLQSGALHTYLTIILWMMVAAVAWPWIHHMAATPQTAPPAGDPGVALGLVALIALSTLVVLVANKRLMAIGGLAGVGAGVALIFLVFGAPDIALTQLLIETLTVIVVSLVLLRLPPLASAKQRSRGRRAMDGALALGVGTVMAALLLGVLKLPLDRSLSAFFEAESYLTAHGRNIVNVILVDFRSLDTWGEISVVVLAAWAAVALIRPTKGQPN